MAECMGCGNEISSYDEIHEKGLCAKCRKSRDAEEQERYAGKQERSKEMEQKIAGIILTTETVVDFKITKRLEIITAECVFGMNIFRDLFAGMTDLVGGRSGATQKVLQDTRKIALDELRKEAHLLGANAVVGVDLDYNEFSGGGKSMLFLVASGTAVIAEI